MSEQFSARQVLSLLPHAALLLDEYGVVHAANDIAYRILRTNADHLIGQPVFAVLDQTGKATFSNLLSQLRRGQPYTPMGTVHLSGVEDVPLLAEYTLHVVHGSKPPWLVVSLRLLSTVALASIESETPPSTGIAYQDLLERYTTIVHRNQELSQKQTYLEQLQQLGNRLNQSLELDEVMREALRGMIEMFHAESGCLILIDEEGHPSRVAVSDECLTLDMTATEHLFEQGLARQALQQSVTLSISDAMALSEPLLLPGRAFLILPLSMSALSGILMLAHGMPGTFDQLQHGTLSAAADTITLALQNAMTYTRLRDTERAHERIIRMLVHDIRNPLTAVSASIDAVKRLLSIKPLTPEIEKMLLDTLESGKVGIRTVYELTGDLQEIARLRAGHHTPKVEPVHLNDVYSEIVNLMQGMATEKEIIIVATVTPPELTIMADLRLVKRMVTNLLVNAMRFTPRHGRIDLFATSVSAHEVLLTVEDTGPGVPSEYREIIFNPGVQAPGESHRGSGLGLALCREVAIAHHGRIWVEDHDGGGARFCVQLPVCSPTEESESSCHCP